MLFGQLPDHKGNQPDQRDDAQRNHFAGVKPVQLLALVEHDLQRTDPKHEQREAHRINGKLLGFTFTLAKNAPGHEG